MKIAIMQPYFFPYIGYFQLINTVDFFVIYDDVNFIKKGWINRNYILVTEKPYLFSVPLQNLSQNKLINEIEIIESMKWRIDFLKTITGSYKKAPFYSSVFPVIEKIINYNQPNLALYIKNSIQQLCDYLEIKTHFITSSDINKNNELKGENKILEICVQLRAKSYINSIGGKELYSSKCFSRENINLQFISPEDIQYKQFNNEFIPWLSIIDVIMFNSKADTIDLINKFKLS